MDHYNYFICKPTSNIKKIPIKEESKESKHVTTKQSVEQKHKSTAGIEWGTGQLQDRKQNTPFSTNNYCNVSVLNSPIKRHTKIKIQLYSVYSNRL